MCVCVHACLNVCVRACSCDLKADVTLYGNRLYVQNDFEFNQSCITSEIGLDMYRVRDKILYYSIYGGIKL